jgi:hypothetical protein
VALTEVAKMDRKLTEGVVSNSQKTKRFNVEKKKKKVRGFLGFLRKLKDLFYIYP